MAAENYRNLGALAFGLFWLTTVILIGFLRSGHTRSISEHMASTRKVSIPFGVVSLVSALLLCVFFVKWFTPNFQLGRGFSLIVVALFLLYAVAGVVPDIKGAYHRIHIFSALTASGLLLPAMILMIVNDQIDQVARLFTAVAVIVMLYIGHQLIKSKRAQNKYLIYEALYFLCFDISVLVATYVR